ncbi:MAG TPA: thioredoxin domain-containing protein [Candidatus Limnocylindrales bacterium]
MSRATQRTASRRERRALARDARPARNRRIPRTDARPIWRSPVITTTVGAIAIGLVAVGFATGTLGGGSPAGHGDLVVPPTAYVGLPVAGAIVGRADAPVTIEVFSDFQCPACKLFITTELPSLLADYVRPGLVKIESKDIDVIDRGAGTESIELASAAACAADQGRYWPFHDLVFWNQGRENHGDHDAAFINGIATAAGLDMTAFQACDAREDLRDAVRQATSAAAASGIAATPTLRINGLAAKGVPQYADLKGYLDQLLASMAPAQPVQTAPTAS